jgi:hypothetical protein
MKVIVIGGRGFLGSRAVAALRKCEGVEVSVASRRGPIRVDLEDASTFESLLGFDVVVDLADTTTSRPDALAAFCLERGLVFVEATSDREAVERLHLALRDREGPGAVILGAGIFTGLSNLIAAEAVRRAPRARALDLAVRTSPYSGAGTGTIELMIAAMAQRTRAFVDGEPVLGPEVARGPRFSFLSGSAPSLQMSLAEPWMIHHSTKIPNVRAFLSPRPTALVYAFLLMPLWLVTARAFRWFFGLYMKLLRRFVLRSVATTVDMIAVADGVEVKLRARDGMGAGGAAVAAIVAELSEKRPRGVRFVDEVIELDPVIERMRGLPHGHVELAVGDTVAGLRAFVGPVHEGS